MDEVKVRKKILLTLSGVAVIVLCYYAGGFVSKLVHGFISPSVMGMLVLFGLLKSGVVKREWVEIVAQFFLDNLMLFFIPVTAGVALVPFSSIQNDLIAIVVSVSVSSFLVLWVVGKIADKFESMRDGNE
ncbi:MAG: CidA/LrgA family protein [Bacteroidales bacterium]|jgi:holin-like protein